MTAKLHNLKKLLTLGLALVLVGTLVSSAAASGISFRNSTTMTIVVQGSSIINGMVRKGQPLVIMPGRSACDSNLSAGKREITIYDVNALGRPLLQETLYFNGVDQYFQVVPLGNTKVFLKTE